jgi:hypothetical protein
MKYKVLFRIGLALVVILFSSYMVGEREEALYYANYHLLFQQDECFANFLSNLNSMEALVFIPEEKISLAKKYDIKPFSSDKATKRNTDFNKRNDSYVQIIPSESATSKCEKSIALNFNTLEMTVFVKKENVKKAQDILQWKGEVGASLNSEMMKFDMKNSETLQLKLERGAWKNYVPVGF